MTLFDKSKVTHIEVTDLIKSKYIWYDEVKEVRKFFGLILVSEGYESGFYNRLPTSCFASINKLSSRNNRLKTI